MKGDEKNMLSRETATRNLCIMNADKKVKMQGGPNVLTLIAAKADCLTESHISTTASLGAVETALLGEKIPSTLAGAGKRTT